MSTCCNHCRATDEHFDARNAGGDLRRYLRKGPSFTTRSLRDGLRSQSEGASLLDIGAGAGALTFELLGRGVEHVTVVDASAAYLGVVRSEAERRGIADSVTTRHGDFVSVVDDVAEVDVVTLDRVVCCYPAFEPLLRSATARARRCLAVSYPRNRFAVRAMIECANLMRRIMRDDFRAFVHSPKEMEAVVHGAGFRLDSRRRSFFWSADVYARAGVA